MLHGATRSNERITKLNNGHCQQLTFWVKFAKHSLVAAQKVCDNKNLISPRVDCK